MINKVEMNQGLASFRKLREVDKPEQNYVSANDIPNFKSKNESDGVAEENKKKKFSFKKLTNIIGVAGWLTVVGIGIYKTGFLRKKSAENIATKAANKAKIVRSQITKTKNDNAELDRLLEGNTKTNKFFAKTFYKIGKWAKDMEEKLGKELYNNLTYAFGTLIVMPLVIWTSPFGKKDSSTSDKAYATLRQPFSVLATFGMQFTFDKLFDKYTPMIIKKNKLETDEIKNSVKDGKVKASLFDKIKYNYDEVKRIFKEELPNLGDKEGGLKGILNMEQAKEILKMPEGLKDDDIATVNEHHDILLKGLKDKSSLNAEELEEFNSRFKSFKDTKFNNEQLSTLEKKLKTISNSCGLNKIAKQRPKVVTNVIFSSFLGCTFLNIIYGKSMKGIEKKRKQNQVAKAGTKEVK